MRTLIKVVIRLALVLMVLQFLEFIVFNFAFLMSTFAMSDSYSGNRNESWSIAITIAIFLIGILIIYFMWNKLDWLVGIIAGNYNENELVIKTSNDDLIKVVFGILGIYLIVTEIPTVAGLIGSQFVIKPVFSKTFRHRLMKQNNG